MTDPIRLAQELVRIPSPSGAEGDLADFLLTTLGAFAEVERGPLGAVVARVSRGEGPTVMLEGHLDTVPGGDEDAWTRGLYTGEIAEGRLWGRGAVDMKGAIACQIAAAASAARDLRGTLLLVYVPYEEIVEGVVLSRVLDQVGKPDLVVLGEPTDLRLGIGHRGRAVVRLTARGKPAHAAMPQLGENAILKMVEALPPALDVLLPTDPLLGEETATPIAVGTPAAGPVVPEACWVLLDRRISRDETPESVLAPYEGMELEARIERVELTAYTGEKFGADCFFPAWWMNPEHPWVVRAREALGSPPMRVWRFSTDGVESCARRGIPTVGYGPGDEALAHQADENVLLADLEKAAAAYRKLLRTLLVPGERAAPPAERRVRRRRR
ncbi:MAG: M20/M25/M40 family metallo-hydrolase [Candidatus Bipolaricaulota bacterium]|nr:M20/M25/M40 family metallo-hydrolase [Candidatus Bipolaricaulota bacterium]